MVIMIVKTLKKSTLLLVTSLCLCLALLLMATPAVEAASSPQPLGNLDIGDKVVDKSWNWDPRTGHNYQYAHDHQTTPQPIIWIVVAKEHYGPGSGVTLLAEDCIGRFIFDNRTHRSLFGYNHWGESGKHATATHGLRPWLNSNGINAGESFYNAFSDSFKKSVEPTRLPNKRQDGKGYETVDYVFIPSATELGDVTTPSAIGEVYEYFDHSAAEDNRKAKLVDDYWNYWTRSPKLGNDEVLRYVGIDGNMNDFIRASSSHTAVRPAINLSSSVKVTKSSTNDFFEILEGEEAVKYKLSFGEPVGQGSHTTIWEAVEYPENSRIVARAIPDTNWKFDKWVINDEECHEPEVVFFMDADKKATAYFTKLTSILTIIETVGEGRVDPGTGEHEYVHGTETEITARAAFGWQFVKWVVSSETDVESDTKNTISITMDQDKVAKAYFSSSESEWIVWDSQETSNTSRAWTVNFNKAPDQATVEKGTVYVTEQNGDTIDIIPVRYEFEGNSLKVIPDGEVYIPGKLYTLWIQGLKAKDGTPLKRCVKMEFKVNS